MEIQKYGCMLKTSSFGAILLAYDIITDEGAQNEPNLPLCPGARSPSGEARICPRSGHFLVFTNSNVRDNFPWKNIDK